MEQHVRAGRAYADTLSNSLAPSLRLGWLVVQPGRRPAVVVGYGTPPEYAFSTALSRLCAVLSDGT